MLMENIVVIGGGGHARVIVSVLKKLKKYHILGYTDPENKGRILGVPYLGGDEVLEDKKKKNEQMSAVIGLGHLIRDDIAKRVAIRRKLETLGFIFPSVVSPDALINENVKIGMSTIVMDGVIINPYTKIGENVIINTGSIIEHDCFVEDNVHIATNVILGGGVCIGRNTLIGSGAIVINTKKVGENCSIGAGAVIADDCLEPGTYVGIPAKRIK
jgi:UDP-perosamine 4-acetyltransferase